MRKTLLTLTTVGLLAVPAGMALAQSDTSEPTGPVPTCVDQEQDRDRECTVDQTCSGTQDQERTRTRLHEEAGDHAGLRDGAGDGAMHRRGPLTDNG